MKRLKLNMELMFTMIKWVGVALTYLLIAVMFWVIIILAYSLT